MRVLTTVSMQSLGEDPDARAMDGCSVCAHLSMVLGMLAAPGAGCTQDRVLLSVRCVAEVLLQAARPLLEVRTAAQSSPSAPRPAGVQGCCADLASFVKHALQE